MDQILSYLSYHFKFNSKKIPNKKTKTKEKKNYKVVSFLSGTECCYKSVWQTHISTVHCTYQV